jgi:hypothetical protein
MQFELRTISDGAEHQVCFLVADGKCRCREFLENLEESSPADVARVVSVIDRIAERGRILNPEVFRPLRDGLFEIAIGKVRIVLFEDGTRLVCTHGFLKSSQKTPIEEIKLGRHLRANFRVELQKGSIIRIKDETET